jgi:hypothetical protein
LEQAVTASEQPANKGADDDASNAASTPLNPPEPESAPLFAVCAVRIADRYFAPGARIDEEYADQLSEKDFTDLLAAASIREG